MENNVLNISDFKKRRGLQNRDELAAEWLMGWPVSPTMRHLVRGAFTKCVDDETGGTPIGIGARTDLPGGADICVSYMDNTTQFMAGTIGWMAGLSFVAAHLVESAHCLTMNDDNDREQVIATALNAIDQLQGGFPENSLSARAFLRNMFILAMDLTDHVYQLESPDAVVLAMLIAEGENGRPEMLTIRYQSEPVAVED